MKFVARFRDAAPVELRQSMLGEGAPRTWIHLAYEGEWKGHSAGEFQFDRGFFERLVDRFETGQENPAPLTYEHPTYNGDTPAAGWIQRLEVRDGPKGAELWAEVELTKKAAEYVREGEYRFCSMVFETDSIDRKSGEPVGPELYEVGLTNQPFIDGQQPIQLSRVGSAAEGNQKMIDTSKVVEDLRAEGWQLSVVALADKSLKQLVMEAFRELGDENPPMDKLLEFLRAKEAVERIKSGGDSGGGETEAARDDEARMSRDDDGAALSDVDLADGMEPAPEPASPEDFMARVLEMLGVTSAEEALSALQALMAPAADGDVPMSKETTAELTKALTHARAEARKLSERVQELEDDKTREQVKSAIEARHLPVEADVDLYVRLSRRAPDEFKALMAAAGAQGPKPPTRQLGKAPPTARSGKGDEEKAAMLARLGFKKSTIDKVAGSN